MEEVKPEKKGFLKKLKEDIDDHEEQMAVLGAAVRLGVVIWSGFIITLSYVELPTVSYTHLTLPTICVCRCRWSPYH